MSDESTSVVGDGTFLLVVNFGTLEKRMVNVHKGILVYFQVRKHGFDTQFEYVSC